MRFVCLVALVTVACGGAAFSGMDEISVAASAGDGGEPAFAGKSGSKPTTAGETMIEPLGGEAGQWVGGTHAGSAGSPSVAGSTTGAGGTGCTIAYPFHYKPKFNEGLKVHVSITQTGNFPEPGTEMTDDGTGVFRASVDLPPGRHLYKFVLGDMPPYKWVYDPANPNKVSDTFLSYNSILDLECGVEPGGGGAGGATGGSASGGAGGEPVTPLPWKACDDEICSSAEVCVHDFATHRVCQTINDQVGHCDTEYLPSPGTNCANYCAEKTEACRTIYHNCAMMDDPATGKACGECTNGPGERWFCGPPT